MESELERAYRRLAAWCRERDFAGHDPFDALNSRLFQATPFKHSRVARLAWTQIFKRSPVSLRKIARVPAGRNAKGTALFALAALANFRRTRTKEAESEARLLLDELQAARLEGWTGAAWGYNFDWQGRAFFAPKGTPTIVPTAFAARALREGARDLSDESYLRVARSACDFILDDLPRSEETEREVCWSYSPVDRTRVFNASLLAAETLCSVGALTVERELCELGVRGARYVVNRQREDGSWAYGADGYQSWADNFHTAFVLTSINRITASYPQCRDEFAEALRRGYEFWRASFFLTNGWPKYFHDRLYPADAHSAGAAIVALLDLHELDSGAPALAQKIALWAIRNLRSERGFFYYQRRRFHTVRTPYMRWSQAWMLYALARLLEGSRQ
ncbi:MAG: hypothetical protein QOJ02_2260 [Acidobacteriota bacterium]|jgi:hypothetical protein|nr:hypothetical protein [Acidobacteriota bacterium]